MNKRIFCRDCGCEVLPGTKVCPYCRTLITRRSPIGTFFLALLKCLGYYAFFFTVQLGVSLVHEIIVLFTVTDISNLPNIDEEAFYAEYSRFMPEIGMLTAAIVLLGYFFFFLIRKKNIFKELSPNRPTPGAVGSGFSLGLTAQIIISLGITYLYSVFPHLSEFSNSETYELMFRNSNPITEFINISIVTGILEEVVFRGLIYNTLKKAIPTWPAIIISGAIFGLAHMNIEQFFYTSLLGVLMAMVYERYGSIIAPIILHATFNGAIYLLAELNFVYLAPYVCIFIFSVALFMLTFAFVFFTKKEPATILKNQRNGQNYEAL